MEHINVCLQAKLQVTVHLEMGDVILSEDAGLLHSSTWPWRMRQLIECSLQLSRWHTGGDINAETASRVLASRFPSTVPPLPPKALIDIIKDLPHPPRSRKEVSTLGRRLNRLNCYPKT